MPAEAIEDHVVAFVSRIASDGTLAPDITTRLRARIEERRTELQAEREQVPARIAAASAKVARLLDELTQLDGKARALAQERLRDESRYLETLEHRLGAIECGLANLKSAAVDATWTARALSDFSRVWDKLTFENRGRLLRSLLESVVVDEHSKQLDIRLADPSAPDSDPAELLNGG